VEIEVVLVMLSTSAQDVGILNCCILILKSKNWKMSHENLSACLFQNPKDFNPHSSRLHPIRWKGTFGPLVCFYKYNKPKLRL